MGVVESRNLIRDAARDVRNATDSLRKYSDAPMHGQVPDWEDVRNQRRELDEAVSAFDAVLHEGMDQEWPKPEPTPS